MSHLNLVFIFQMCHITIVGLDIYQYFIAVSLQVSFYKFNVLKYLLQLIFIYAIYFGKWFSFYVY